MRSENRRIAMIVAAVLASALVGYLIIGVAVLGALQPTRSRKEGFRPGAPVTYVPGTIHEIARGSLRGTAGYSLFAARYGFEHRTYSELGITVFHQGGGSDGTNLTPSTGRPLSWSTEQGCAPSAHMWTIVYGVLADVHYRAYAFVGPRRYPLRTALIPARDRMPGAAAFVGLSNRPSRILVTSPSGQTLMSRSLEPLATEHCEPGTSIMILEKRSSERSR